MSVDLVIPTSGRQSLRRLLEALADEPRELLPGRLLIVDDRRWPRSPLAGAGLFDGMPHPLRERVEVLASGGRGPAAARNVGWRASRAEWVSFLDDDVVPARGWCEALARDLRAVHGRLGGSQGQVRVPLPHRRRPTDWERNVASLESARWATADMAYRREALHRTGGFDERFPRAYREDADLALRARSLGYRLERGRREVEHPPGPGPFWVSVALQRGNADDALMRRLHGRHWRRRAGAPPGRLPRHAAIVACAAASSSAGAARRRRPAAGAALLALAGVAELALARILPGPRDRSEVTRMVATSIALPFAAVAQRLRGELRWRGAQPLRGRAQAQATHSRQPAAVLFDRDGTLVHDVPYNGDPAKVVPMPTAREALDELRAAEVPIAVISNQSGIGRGLLGEADVRAVNERIEQLLGPVAAWLHCPHVPDEGCGCRKPRPGLVLAAAELLDVDAERCAVVGDIGSDIGAASAAGARSVLVPTARTRRGEVTAAAETAPDLLSAVRRLMEPLP